MHRSEVAPERLAVDLIDGGIVVCYEDDREVFYNGVPEAVSGPVRARPGASTQVLVTDPDGETGLLTYINDRDTHDDILETTGVGRIFVAADGERTVFPGVTVARDGHAPVVAADTDAVGGRVFVFVEDELYEDSYEVVD
ncbi:hypothetical protein BRD17_06965 [Halobacteriales archaeon SW_7_68_16]|nr:MAG: hypothetical protein BRD17_06965 [Halobacteriales archaeon SW_7_68_16]